MPYRYIFPGLTLQGPCPPGGPHPILATAGSEVACGSQRPLPWRATCQADYGGGVPAPAHAPAGGAHCPHLPAPHAHPGGNCHSGQQKVEKQRAPTWPISYLARAAGVGQGPSRTLLSSREPLTALPGACVGPSSASREPAGLHRALQGPMEGAPGLLREPGERHRYLGLCMRPSAAPPAAWGTAGLPRALCRSSWGPCRGLGDSRAPQRSKRDPVRPPQLPVGWWGSTEVRGQPSRVSLVAGGGAAGLHRASCRAQQSGYPVGVWGAAGQCGTGTKSSNSTGSPQSLY